MFSSRLPAELAENAVARALDRLGRTRVTVFDLTETNPTVVGLPYPPSLASGLADPRVASYHPHPFGRPDARAAVAAACRTSGWTADVSRIVLTASTSEAYAFLFKLLCDPGDEILVPQPSYPLFDLLAGLEGVSVARYGLHPFDAWAIDRVGLAKALTERTRAILVVTPNNPTGSMLRASDRDWLVSTAAERQLALISDEVFADYPLAPLADAVSLSSEDRVLTFTLGGLSKSAGLPQMKLAWIGVSGPDASVREALSRLELIADTYLSVSTPVQVAAGSLIEAGRDIRSALARRLSENLSVLRSTVRAYPALTLVEPEGGWSAVLRIPSTVPEEQVVLKLIDDAHVVVHPGYFFDFPGEAYLVLSLLPEPAVFAEGVSRLARLVAGGFL